MKRQVKEEASQARLTERPAVRATGLDVKVTSTKHGVMIEGSLHWFQPDGRRIQGPKVRDAYGQNRPLSNTELLAFLAWWSNARCEMLPDRPNVEPGLPQSLDRIAAKQPGSLPGEGKGRAAVERKTGRKADPIKGREGLPSERSLPEPDGTAP